MTRGNSHLVDFEGITCTATALAQLFGVTRKTIYEWTNNETLPRIKRGHYSVVEALNWYVERMTATARGEAKDLEEQRLRLLKQQTEGHELKNAQMRGALVPVVDLEAMAMRLASLIVEQLDLVPSWTNDPNERIQLRERSADAKRYIERTLRDLTRISTGGDADRPAPGA